MHKTIFALLPALTLLTFWPGAAQAQNAIPDSPQTIQSTESDDALPQSITFSTSPSQAKLKDHDPYQLVLKVGEPVAGRRTAEVEIVRQYCSNGQIDGAIKPTVELIVPAITGSHATAVQVSPPPAIPNGTSSGKLPYSVPASVSVVTIRYIGPWGYPSRPANFLLSVTVSNAKQQIKELEHQIILLLRKIQVLETMTKAKKTL